MVLATPGRGEVEAGRARGAQVASPASVQITAAQSSIAAHATQVAPSSQVPARQLHAYALAPLSRQVPVPHGASAQSSLSVQPRAPSGSKPLAQVAQVASALVVQVTARQSATTAQAVQVVPSSNAPAGQLQS